MKLTFFSYDDDRRVVAAKIRITFPKGLLSFSCLFLTYGRTGRWYCV